MSMSGSSLEPGPVGSLLRWQFNTAHRLLDAAVDQLTDDALRGRRPADVARAGVCFAQAVLGEDLSVNGVLAGGRPLAFSSWAGRTGMSEIPPLAGTAAWRDWARRVRLDLSRVRPYARAVYASTDAYLAALPEDELPPLGGGTCTCVLSALLLTLARRSGEVAELLRTHRERGPT
jgi:hypothetical protein